MSKISSPPTSPPPNSTITLKESAKLLHCGLISGLLQAFFFNPWDRALYLSLRNTRPFLSIENFKNPMEGVTQTVIQRAVSAGLYFPLEEIFSSLLNEKQYFHSPQVNSFLAGTCSGIINGIVMNPFTRVKYRYWSKGASTPTPAIINTNFISTTLEIFRTGGTRQFFVGTSATVSRDLIFGGCFALLRHEVIPKLHISSSVLSFLHSTSSENSPEKNSSLTNKTNKKYATFIDNLIAGLIATIVSAPVNYVRNIQYQTSPSKAPLSSTEILLQFKEAVKNEKTLPDALRLIQSRFRIGWGTARVGCGMAFGALVYDTLSK